MTKTTHKKEPKEKLWLGGPVVGSPKLEVFADEKHKCTFEIQGKSGRTLTCIYWANVKPDIGEHVLVNGRYDGDIFVVWKMMRNYEV